jgi:hypothetical protein
VGWWEGRAICNWLAPVVFKLALRRGRFFGVYCGVLVGVSSDGWSVCAESQCRASALPAS